MLSLLGNIVNTINTSSGNILLFYLQLSPDDTIFYSKIFTLYPFIVNFYTLFLTLYPFFYRGYFTFLVIFGILLCWLVGIGNDTK